MEDNSNSGNLSVRLQVDPDSSPHAVPSSNKPFRLLLLGDFGGKRQAGGASLCTRRVDRDTIDEVMARLAVRCDIELAPAPAFALRLGSIDDFHPDRLVHSVAILNRLDELRRSLDDPATFDEASAVVRSWWGSDTSPESSSPESSSPESSSPEASSPEASTPEELSTEEPPSTLDGASLLSAIIDAAPSNPLQRGVDPKAEHDRADHDLSGLVRTIVGADLVEAPDPRYDQLVASVDAAAGSILRAILRSSSFRSLEQTWRSLAFLTRRLETDERLQVHLLDVTQEELAEELRRYAEGERTELSRLIVEETINAPDADRWGILVGDFTFEATLDDATTLTRMAELAERAGAPFVASAGASMLGCESIAQTPDADDWSDELDPLWSEAFDRLRRSSAGQWVSLVTPRFMLRLPYGGSTDPIESFEFEEVGPEPDHEEYLWGNSAILFAYLQADGLSRNGWHSASEVAHDITGLPLHSYRSWGESFVKPCAETLLSARTTEEILNRGIVPLLSMKGSDRVRIARFQSIISN